MSPTVRKWLRGLVAAAVNSGASAVTVVVVDPFKFNLQNGKSELLQVVIVSAIVGISLYLKDHALPEDEPYVIQSDGVPVIRRPWKRSAAQELSNPPKFPPLGE